MSGFRHGVSALVGDRIMVMWRGACRVGTVAALGPTRAVVVLDDYTVIEPERFYLTGMADL